MLSALERGGLRIDSKKSGEGLPRQGDQLLKACKKERGPMMKPPGVGSKNARIFRQNKRLSQGKGNRQEKE